RAWVKAVEQAGIRAPGRGRRVGDYELGQLLGEGENWQDFAARHAATGVNRRVRVYPYARAATPQARDRLARPAANGVRSLGGGSQRSPRLCSTIAGRRSGPPSCSNMILRPPAWTVTSVRSWLHSPSISGWLSYVSLERRWLMHMASASTIAALRLRAFLCAT